MTLKIKNVYVATTYLDLRKRNLLGHEMNLMIISKLNHALQTHSTKKNASWALVWALSKVQAEVLKDVRTVMFRMTGTRMSGCVFKQNDTMETTMKKTEMMPTTWKTVTRCRLLRHSGGGGQVVSVLALYCKDPSSNPAENYIFFCEMCVWKERK